MGEKFNTIPFVDLAYAGQSESQKLDIYIPERAPKPYPVLMLIHGGGFIFGDKVENVADEGAQALEKGYAVVSINYRYSFEATFPAQIFDAKAAVRYVRANAPKYNLDPTKIVAWGSSAGAYLAALLGTSGDVAELEDLNMGNADFSSRLNAAIIRSGPIDFLEMDHQHRILKHKPDYFNDTETSGESTLIGGLVSKHPEKCKIANPITYIRDDNPPFYIQYSKNDVAIPYLQGVVLAEYLKAAIGESKVKLELSDTGGHGADSFPFGNRPPNTWPEGFAPGKPTLGLPVSKGDSLKKVFVFLDKHLKGNNPSSA